MKRISIFIVMFLTLIMLPGCANNLNHNVEKSLAKTYEGEADGYGGKIKVMVTIDENGKITLIEVDGDHNETEGVSDIPIQKIPESIIALQSLDIEAVTGATITGDAIIKAVANALTNAGLDALTYGFIENESSETIYELDLDAMPIKAPITDSLTITDAKGRKVNLDLPISTYGISTMDVIDFIIPILYEEAFDKLVASGQDGGGGLQGYAKLYTPIIGPYLKHVGQISDHNAPFDLEMILATDPDVIIVNSAMGAHKYALEVEPQLTAAGIPIVLIDVPGESFTSSVQDTIKLLGQIFQKEERANDVISFIDKQYELIESKNLANKKDPPTVYYEKSGYSEIFGSTSSSISGWGRVIASAGGYNIADPILLQSAGSKGASNTLDPEYIIQSDPDFIILSGSGAGWMDNFKGSSPKIPKFDIVNRVGWNNLKAVKNNNVYEIAHATSRSIFGFHAALKLAKTFYPDEFRSIDPDAIMDDFFKRFMLVDSDVTGWMYKISEVVR